MTTDIPTPADRTFDRIPSPPSRSAEYPMALLTDGQPVRPYTWQTVQLDQGHEGACVAFDSTMEAAARPRPYFGDPIHHPPDIPALNAYALGMYELCREHDQHRYPSGATQLSGMKVGIDLGYWKAYYWATGTPTEQARQTLVAIRKGPVCFAADWHTGMDHRTPDGYLEPTGAIRGGHSFLLASVGWDHGLGEFYAWTPNSWGGHGQGRLTETSITTLFANGAEAAIPTNRLLQHPTP